MTVTFEHVLPNRRGTRSIIDPPWSSTQDATLKLSLHLNILAPAVTCCARSHPCKCCQFHHSLRYLITVSWSVAQLMLSFELIYGAKELTNFHVGLLVSFCGGHFVLVFGIFRKATSCWTYVIVQRWHFLCIKSSSPRETFICWQWNEGGYAGVLFGGRWCHWHLFVKPRVSSEYALLIPMWNYPELLGIISNLFL